MTNADAIVMVRDCVLFVSLGAGVYTDVTRGKVYDWVTLPAIGLGLVLSGMAGVVDAAQGDTSGGILGGPLISSLAGLALALGVFGVAYLLHVLGGGDVKLMGAVGALMGLDFFISAAILTACAGAVVAVGVLIWRGRLLEGLKSAILAVAAPRRFRKRRESAPPGAAEMMTIPYTIAIVAGTLAAWVLTGTG